MLILVWRRKNDKDVINDGTSRCDYLLMNDDSADAYLIELKGSDIEYGLEQLEATASHLQKDLKGYMVKYRLIHSRAKTQAINGIKFKKFCRRHNKQDEFRHHEGQLTDTLKK